MANVMPAISRAEKSVFDPELSGTVYESHGDRDDRVDRR
jgi:hypothetical protein